MERAVIVRGRISGARRIDLDEPLEEVSGDVEVLVRSVPGTLHAKSDVDDVLRTLPRGSRTRAAIDSDVARERAEWDAG